MFPYFSHFSQHTQTRSKNNYELNWHCKSWFYLQACKCNYWLAGAWWWVNEQGLDIFHTVLNEEQISNQLVVVEHFQVDMWDKNVYIYILFIVDYSICVQPVLTICVHVMSYNMCTDFLCFHKKYSTINSCDLVQYAAKSMMSWYDVISYHMFWLNMTLRQVISHVIVNVNNISWIYIYVFIYYSNTTQCFFAFTVKDTTATCIDSL